MDRAREGSRARYSHIELGFPEKKKRSSNSALLSSSVCNPAHAPHILYRTRFVIELGSSYSIQRRGVWCLVLEGGMGRARVAKSRTNEGILRMNLENWVQAKSRSPNNSPRCEITRWALRQLVFPMYDYGFIHQTFDLSRISKSSMPTPSNNV